jgi:ABC-type sugar transport system ATPase subunit
VVKTSETNEQELVKMMVGRDLGDVYNSLERNYKYGDVVLSLDNVSNDKVKNISFSIKSGEIVGLSGLAGAGRTETARIIFGADPMESGSMVLKGKNYRPSLPKVQF